MGQRPLWAYYDCGRFNLVLYSNLYEASHPRPQAARVGSVQEISDAFIGGIQWDSQGMCLLIRTNALIMSKRNVCTLPDERILIDDVQNLGMTSLTVLGSPLFC